MKRPEQELQIDVAAHLDMCLPRDAVWFHVPNGGKRTKAEAGILKAMGVKAGVHDVWIFWRGIVLAIELKAAAGKLTDHQVLMKLRLQRAGVFCAEARSIEDVYAVLMTHKVPIRGRISA
jgi:hypothetical protein